MQVCTPSSCFRGQWLQGPPGSLGLGAGRQPAHRPSLACGSPEMLRTRAASPPRVTLWDRDQLGGCLGVCCGNHEGIPENRLPIVAGLCPFVRFAMNPHNGPPSSWHPAPPRLRPGFQLSSISSSSPAFPRLRQGLL